MSQPQAYSNNQGFTRQLRNLQRDVLLMGALVESSCWLARQALFDRQLDAVKQIALQDKEVDALYRKIEADCVNLIAAESPDIQELRLLSAMMQLVRDIERIGDYAKDLGEIALKLFTYPVHDCMPRIQVMVDRCRAMLAMSLEALTNLDAKVGIDIKNKDDSVDQDYEEIYTLLSQQTDVQGAVEPIILLVLVIRHLERMADHATNIGGRVVYVVTGERA